MRLTDDIIILLTAPIHRQFSMLVISSERIILKQAVDREPNKAFTESPNIGRSTLRAIHQSRVRTVCHWRAGRDSDRKSAIRTPICPRLHPLPPPHSALYILDPPLPRTILYSTPVPHHPPSNIFLPISHFPTQTTPRQPTMPAAHTFLTYGAKTAKSTREMSTRATDYDLGRVTDMLTNAFKDRQFMRPPLSMYLDTASKAS